MIWTLLGTIHRILSRLDFSCNVEHHEKMTEKNSGKIVLEIPFII